MGTRMRVMVTQGEVTMTVALTVLDCAQCGVIFGIPDLFDKNRRQDGQAFFCPNGHNLTFGQSEVDRLKARLAAEAANARHAEAIAERIAAERDDAKNALRTTKGVVTKMRRRAMAGACPFGCHRTFADLQRHIVSKHADETVDTAGES